MKRVHFIAIGGSAMHNLAIALKQKAYKVTGSDDEIFEPALSRLKQFNILPEKIGWFPSNITPDIDTVILGMHARIDNPELLKAQQLNLQIVSYPEFLYNETKNKLRIAVGGSHGKTTTTAMIMHALQYANIEFDYMVGAQLTGFDYMVGLSGNSKIAIFEGDEYLSSPVDKRSKFLWYKPQIAIITGIEWDHINVFPTFNSYLDTFRQFMENMPESGKLFWFEGDKNIETLIKTSDLTTKTVSYSGFEWRQLDGKIQYSYNNKSYTTELFGNHNFQNMHAAFLVCKELGITETTFFEAINTFKGASRRLQIIKKEPTPIYYDFAHAPSKVLATVNAVRQMFPQKKVIACLELHTFSSLNKDFIPNYKNTLNNADQAFVYLNPDVFLHKKLPAIDTSFISNSFNHPVLSVFNHTAKMFNRLHKEWENGAVILIMSSGNFGGNSPENWANEI